MPKTRNGEGSKIVSNIKTGLLKSRFANGVRNMITLLDFAF